MVACKNFLRILAGHAEILIKCLDRGLEAAADLGREDSEWRLEDRDRTHPARPTLSLCAVRIKCSFSLSGQVTSFHS